MAIAIDDLATYYIFDDPIQLLVHEITNQIKIYDDYDSAIKIMLDNNLNIENIVKNTARLKTSQIVELAMKLISMKR